MRQRALSFARPRGARLHADYSSVPLTHNDLLSRYCRADVSDRRSSASEGTRLLGMLERVEEVISKWRLNRWQYRVPPMLRADVKEQVMLQQDMLKSVCINHSKRQSAVQSDMGVISRITNLEPAAIYVKSRAWLQEETARLRWNGEVNAAKELRDAFLRLECYGAREHKLLERLCCVYGMALQGTFEDAFSNLIVEDPVTKVCRVDQSNVFSELMASMIHAYPDMHIIYRFLGFSVSGGYSPALKEFCCRALAVKCGLEGRAQSGAEGGLKDDDSDAAMWGAGEGRISFQQPSTREVFFHFGDSSALIDTDDSVYGLPDYLYIRGCDVFLITIASSNHWLRSRQTPHRKQLEGIARRSSFVLGIPYDKVRVRNLLLPPVYLDKSSIQRILDVVLELTPDQQKHLAPWLPFYDKELDASDVDFCELAKTINEEEWLTL